MPSVKQWLLLICSLLLGGCATTGSGGSDDRIHIREADGRYTLSVPTSQLIMAIPSDGWSQKAKNIGGGTGNPRYFYFENEKESVILSGWFEPAHLFTGPKQLWQEESARQTQGGMPGTVNVTYGQQGGWQTVMYDYLIGKATSSHIRGHWVQAGTWIDLHFSTTTNTSGTDNRKKLESWLSKVSVTEQGIAQDSDRRRYAVGDRGAIAFAVPEDWRDEVQSQGRNLPPTIVFSSQSEPRFEMMVTPIWAFKADIPTPTMESLRESAHEFAEAAQSQAVEPEIPIEEFTGPETVGAYFSATDRDPKPGEYQYMTQGIMGVADLRATFTILTNEGRAIIVPKALAMLRSARRMPAP